MASPGSVQGKVSLDVSDFQAAAKIILGLCKDIGDVMKTTFGVAFGTLAATAVEKLVSVMKDFATSIPRNLEAVFQLGENLANVSHASRIAADQFEIFRTAVEKGISFQEAAGVLGRNAELMRNDASIFRDVQLKIFEAGQRVEGFWIGFADKVAPVISVMLDKFNALDFTGWGQQFAEPIAKAIEVIYQLAQDGSLWDTMGKLFQLALLSGMDALAYLANIAESVFQVAFDFAVQYFMTALHQGFQVEAWGIFNMMVDGFKWVASKFYDFLVLAIRSSLAVMTLGLSEVLMHFPKLFGEIEKGGNTAVSNYKAPEQGKSFSDSLKDSISKISFGSDASKRLGDEIAKVINNAQEKFKIGNDESGQHFSNLTAIQNFGVSSLQKLGLGGTANGPGGTQDALVNYASKTVDRLGEIKTLLESRNNQSTTMPGVVPQTKVAVKITQ